MAIYGNGRDYDITLKPDSTMRTTTAQYMCVGMVPGTTTVDRTVERSGDTGTVGGPTQTAFHFIGVNQSYLSSGSEECSVRVFGVSKVSCAESITAGEYVMAYWGASSTTRGGQIVAVEDGITVSSATHSISAHVTIVGRALEDGSTGTVISVFVNPSLYDLSLVGTIGIT